MVMEINNTSELHAAIKKLEQQNAIKKDKLVEDFHFAYESLKPINILKNSLNKVVHSPGVVENIINATLGLGAGVLSKKLLIGKSAGILKKLLGTAVEFGVAGLVSKNSDSIKSGGLNLLSKIFKSKRSRQIQH
jgi:hypothetical protein